MKKIIVLLLIVASSVSLFAQKTKFGHVDSNSLFSVMPEKEQASKAIEEYAKTLETQLQALNQELRNNFV